MVIIGCTPKGRHTEQHDVYFGIANNIAEMLPQLQAFWPEVATKLHVDAFKAITAIEGYKITVIPKLQALKSENQLFFLNLGGYKPHEMEEFHYKMIVVAASKAEAITQAKQTAFYKHTGFKGATSHIDDKYGVDVDDIYSIEDILPKAQKNKYQINITKVTKQLQQDELHLGYYKQSKLLTLTHL